MADESRLEALKASAQDWSGDDRTRMMPVGSKTFGTVLLTLIEEIENLRREVESLKSR